MRFLLLPLAALLMFGCASDYGAFSTISTKDIDFTRTYKKGDEKVIGTDTTYIYFLIPTKLHPDASVAVKDALTKSCAEYLSDAQLALKHWYIPYIYGRTWFEIEGYPWYLENDDRENCFKKEELSKSNHMP